MPASTVGVNEVAERPDEVPRLTSSWPWPSLTLLEMEPASVETPTSCWNRGERASFCIE